MLKSHFPYAAAVFTGLPLAFGDGALFILALTAALALVPFVYGRDAEEIAAQVRKSRDK
jgi:hypothetical protein